MKVNFIVFFGCFLLHRCEDESSEEFPDFDLWVMKFARSKVAHLNRNLKWVEAYGNHSILLMNPEFKPYKVQVKLGDFRYGTPTPGKRIVMSDVRQYANSSPHTINISSVREIRSRLEWLVTEGLYIKPRLTITAVLPENIDIKSFEGFEPIDINLQNIHRQRMSFRLRTLASKPIVVPPWKGINEELTITEETIQVPFTVAVYIFGYIAIWYDAPHLDHRLWFYPTCHLSNDNFKTHNKGLVYYAKGSFKGPYQFEMKSTATPFSLSTNSNEN